MATTEPKEDSARCLTNAFTVDVEDYFHVSAFESVIPREAWSRQPQRIERNMQVLLGLLAEQAARATFFSLGWVAERYPQLMRSIVQAGHELASHGYDHTRVTHMTPAQFREDIVKTKRILEDTSGAEVKGYRAPTFSVGKDTLWAFAILEEAGYRYSSSIYPVKHDLYGMPDAPRHAFHEASTGFLEIPVSTVRLAGRNFPCGGGGFFRLYPYALTQWSLRRINQQERKPCIFYMHPWEIDPEQPRQRAIPLRTRIRHYMNLTRMEGRLRHLLGDFRWGRMDQIFLP